MENDFEKVIEKVYKILAEVKRNKEFRTELTVLIQKYLPGLFADKDQNSPMDKTASSRKKGSGQKGTSSKVSNKETVAEVPDAVFDPLEFARKDESALPEKLMELTIQDLRYMIRMYNLDPFGVTKSVRKKEKIIQTMVETVHSRINDGAPLRRN